MTPTAKSGDSPPTAAPWRSARSTAISILALVLGATGILGVLGANVESLGGTGPPLSSVMNGMPEIEQAVTVYLDTRQKLATAAAGQHLHQVMFVTVHLAVAVGLLAGGALGLRDRPAAAAVLLAAFGGGVFLELARLMPSIRQGQQANLIIQREAPRILRAISGPPPRDGTDGIAPPTAALVRAAGKTAIAVKIAATLFKVVYYCIGLRSLTCGSSSSRRPPNNAGFVHAATGGKTPHHA